MTGCCQHEKQSVSILTCAGIAAARCAAVIVLQTIACGCAKILLASHLLLLPAQLLLQLQLHLQRLERGHPLQGSLHPQSPIV